MFLIINDVGILQECGFLKNDNNRLYINFENILKKNKMQITLSMLKMERKLL